MSAQAPTRPVYYAVFAALIVLLFATVGVAYIHLGPLNDLAALTIAVLKATLVVLFFMHVRYSKKLIGLVAVAGLVWLALLIGFTITDYATREWMSGGVPGF